MKKKWLGLVMAGVLSASVLAPSATVYADGQKVVTLGADLDEAQRNAVLRYFGVQGQNVQTIYITNQDERDHLGSYIPLEQIGTRTYSCAMVNPTRSGGIQVKTANLSYVTSNMIATTLSTSGVVNCEVLAAAPFEVSGTGALTGIIMAYETASGVQLDTQKKETATQEMMTTIQIADSVGQAEATEIVNEIKIQVIQNQATDPTQVEKIVEDVVNRVVEERESANLTQEDQTLLADLAYQISEQNYNFDDVKETLYRVEDNVSQAPAAAAETKEEAPEGTLGGDTVDGVFTIGESAEEEKEIAVKEDLPEDSILLATDDTALGESVNIDATTSEAIQESEPAAPEDGAEDDFSFDIFNEDTYSDETPADDNSGAPEENAEDDFWTSDEGEKEDITIDDGAAADPAVVEDLPEDEFTGEEELPEGTDEGTAEEPAPEDAAQAPEIGESQVETTAQKYHEDNMGTTIVSLYLPAAGLVPVNGSLEITDPFGNQTTVDLLSDGQTEIVPMSQEELSGRGWSEGTRVIINTGSVMDITGSYNVIFRGDIAKPADGQDPSSLPTTYVQSETTVSADGAGIAVETDRLDALRAGSSVTARLITESVPEAVSAEITAVDGFGGGAYLDSNTTSLDLLAGDTFQITLEDGKTVITADLYDEAGNYLSTVTKTVESIG